MNQTTLNYRYTLGVSSLLLVSLTPLQAQALTVEEVPNPQQNNDGWVTDMAEILNDNTEDKLNTLISQLEAENGTEIAVVTVPQTSPSATPKDFTTELFNHWGIGKADEDNGILFLVSTGDRRVEIETGYGIEPILPDAKVGNIIDTKITPQFKQGNYDDGTIAGTQALVDALQNQTSTETNQSDSFFGSLPFFGLITILAVVTGLLFKRKRHSSTDKSYTGSNYRSNNNLNSDRSDKDRSSINQTITKSKKSVGDRHSKSDRKSDINNSSSSKNHRRSSRYSGTSYIDGSSYGGSRSSSSGSSSSGSSSGSSSSGSGSSSGYSGGSSGGGYSGGGGSGGSSSSGSSGGGGAGGGF